MTMLNGSRKVERMMVTKNRKWLYVLSRGRNWKDNKRTTKL